MMFIKTHICKNIYRDSVFLMRLSTKIRKLEGVIGAEVIIGTDHNKKFLQGGELWSEQIEKEATANDLIIVIKALDRKTAEKGISLALEGLEKQVGQETATDEYEPYTFETALKQMPEANLALLSIPGRFVLREAERILDNGLNVMIFSDNVPLEAELHLKQKALEKGLFVMGPDCGTAFINGIPLAFANEVRRGSIGIVGASGTGMQEVSTIIHNLGEGISQAIGTGGRDIKAEIGGLMMIYGLQTLLEDPETKVIVIVSKPPDLSVAKKILQVAASGSKPVVINFIGGDLEQVKAAGCEPALTLKEAAEKAVRLVRRIKPEKAITLPRHWETLIGKEKQQLKKGQTYLRGLFSGGTLAHESLTLLHGKIGDIYSNLALETKYCLVDFSQSQGHTIIDLGEDEFTQGRLHPMIDPTIRNQRLLKEATDPSVAVIMFDMVLGYNAHPDPAGAISIAIREAKRVAIRDGRHLIFVTSVCGTDEDPQNRQEQVRKLEEAGVIVFSSNAEACLFVSQLLS